jgi:hypothetical protein
MDLRCKGDMVYKCNGCDGILHDFVCNFFLKKSEREHVFVLKY